MGNLDNINRNIKERNDLLNLFKVQDLAQPMDAFNNSVHLIYGSTIIVSQENDEEQKFHQIFEDVPLSAGANQINHKAQTHKIESKFESRRPVSNSLNSSIVNYYSNSFD